MAVSIQRQNVATVASLHSKIYIYGYDSGYCVGLTVRVLVSCSTRVNS
jgi:hypothetical protein